MLLNVCIPHHLICFILFPMIIARDANDKISQWNEPSIKSLHRSAAGNAHGGSPRLITAQPLLHNVWQSMPILPQGLKSQNKETDLFPVQSVTPILETSINSHQQHVENKTLSEHPGTHLQTVSLLNPQSPLLSKGYNETLKVEVRGKPNKTEESEKPLAGDKPANLPATVSNSNKTSNHSAGQPVVVDGQGSKLLLSLQTVSGTKFPGANISDIERAANTTSNKSAVLISNSREIEVVIFADHPPNLGNGLAQKNATDFQLSLASNPSSRSFPSRILYNNGSFVGARRPPPLRYPARLYWPVYLTLTMLCLSALAICVVCCTSQGRRDMSIPPPKPVEYGQQLPPYTQPYTYVYSYDMRQAEGQEAAHLNPTNP